MRYFVLDDAGNQYGPADLLTLQQWVTEGRVLAATKLKEEMSGTVVLAGQVTGLQFPMSSAAPGQQGQQGATGDFAQNPYEHGPRPTQFADYHRPSGTPVDTQTVLIKAIVATVCCGCWPLGVVAIVFAFQANGSNSSGDYVKAKELVNKSNLFSNIALIFGVVIGEIYLFAVGVGAATGNLN